MTKFPSTAWICLLTKKINLQVACSWKNFKLTSARLAEIKYCNGVSTATNYSQTSRENGWCVSMQKYLLISTGKSLRNMCLIECLISMGSSHFWMKRKGSSGRKYFGKYGRAWLHLNAKCVNRNSSQPTWVFAVIIRKNQNLCTDQIVELIRAVIKQQWNSLLASKPRAATPQNIPSKQRDKRKNIRPFSHIQI